ncbi:unnamed protein product [Ceutorhynchus assimilis]|uniref:Uncharacterized protein n=1 Tax=Ceutorhynchus assimilis TaxID=467358 RepID=A0A9N9QR23_9CUCU|nr:unnamed protein product [Ceutorhynchus assimilis]
MTDSPLQFGSILEQVNIRNESTKLEKEPSLHYLSEKSILLYKVPDEIVHAPTPSSTPKQLITDCYTTILPNFPESIQNIKIPYVREVGIRDAIASLAPFFKCDDYKNNLVQFWFLDIIVDCLWISQDEYRFSISHQKCILEWLLFVFKLISSVCMTKTLLFEIFYEAMAIAEVYVQAGGEKEPLPNMLFTLNLNGTDSHEELSLGSSSTMENKSSTELKPSNEYFVIKSGESCQVFKLPIKEAPAVDCCDFSISSISDEPLSVEEQLEVLTNKISEESDIDFYKVDYSTPPRFKSLQELDKSISIESDLNYPNDDSSESIIGDWYDIPRKEPVPLCPSKTITEILSPDDQEHDEEISREQSFRKSTKQKGEKNETNDNHAKPSVDGNIIEDSGSPQDIFKAFYDYNLWKLKNEFMDNSKIGWTSLSSEETVQSSHKSDKNIPDINLKQRTAENEKEIFIKSCLLLAIKQIVQDYFENNFTFELIRISLTNPQFLITQDLNVYWNIPKVIKGELKKPMPKKMKKEKPKKEPKTKKEKSTKGATKSAKDKKSKKSDKKLKADKKSKVSSKSGKSKKQTLSKEEQKEHERQRKEQEALEMELFKQAENTMFMFPLKEAVDEIFFTRIFPNFKKKGAAKTAKNNEESSKKSEDKKSGKKDKKKKKKQ